MYDHAGRTFTLLGDSDRARCHSRFHPAIRLAGWLTSKVNRSTWRPFGPELKAEGLSTGEKKVTLNGEP